ncbi:mitochondrial outer membrane translocase complex, subunit Tom22, partial [Blyttiomyces helicus]
DNTEIAAIPDVSSEDEDLSEDDLSDDDEDDNIDEESLLDRFRALADVVPPTTRASIVSTVTQLAAWPWAVAKFAGSAAWVIATGATLVLLPVAFEMEKEVAILQQDAQARMQQQQAQQV